MHLNQACTFIKKLKAEHMTTTNKKIIYAQKTTYNVGFHDELVCNAGSTNGNHRKSVGCQRRLRLNRS